METIKSNIQGLYREPKYIVKVCVDGKCSGEHDPLTKTEAESKLEELYTDLICGQREQGRRIIHEWKYNFGDINKMPLQRRYLHPRAVFIKFFQSEKRTFRKIIYSVFSFELIPC